ncbi:amidohydrolase family protein [Candidatus Solincola tengchongensis]|uniref:amidohydrolase family protein n=1 Tax=Candidatus Solincola tengchongensis TaxID=2900693 RepID=UPI00257A8519|nr:amidohydrolase family protein [Candidatus Solincola tengchongensis]
MIIDAHTHLFPPRARERPASVSEEEIAFRLLFASGGQRMVSPEEMLSEMDSEGVDAAVLCPFPWMTLRACAENNDYILEVASSHPGRFIPFAVANPRWGRPAVEEARRCLEAGARGIGELHAQPQGFDLLDEGLVSPLVELAVEYGVPIMVHVNEPVGHTYPGKGPVTPETAYRLVRTYPEAVFILPHWGGGLLFYELMPEVAEECRNVYYDTAASPFLYRSGIYRLAAEAAGSGKILFATDYPLLPYRRTLADARNGLENTPFAQEVLGGNAARLFGVTKV